MKTIKTLCLTIILLISASFSLNAVESNSYGIKKVTTKLEVTLPVVIQYLQQTGHTLLCQPVSRNGGYTWSAITTIKNDGHTYITTVFTDGVNVIGHEDDILD